jgi:hypothetical protein
MIIKGANLSFLLFVLSLYLENFPDTCNYFIIFVIINIFIENIENIYYFISIEFFRLFLLKKA